MRHDNSVFHSILKHVPWARFERLVEEHGSDFRVRSLDSKRQLVAMLYGQLAGAQGLREIENGLKSHEARLYHLGAAPAKRSTLSDANRERPAALFSGLFTALCGQAHRGLRKTVTEATYLIDSTSLKLNAMSAWAHFSTGVFGAKAHIVYDAAADCPIYASVTPANVNDITAAHEMPIEPGATYVFDLGYYDFAWWAAMDAKGCRIVTRLKSHTKLAIAAEHPVPKGGAILSDRTGYLPTRNASSRTPAFADPVREVRVRIESGKILRILSNDLDAGAQEIADLYKRRWAITAVRFRFMATGGPSDLD